MEVQVAVCGVVLKKDNVLILRRATADEFAERGFISALGVVAEQSGVRLVVHSPIKQPPR